MTLAHEKGSDDDMSAEMALMNRQDQNLIEEFGDEMLDEDGDLAIDTQLLLE